MTGPDTAATDDEHDGCLCGHVRGRACWQVEFPDGATDQWVISDKDGRYEYR